jgi:mono/diheme cytochrome c family protein
MKCNFLVSSTVLVLGASVACWAADDGAALYKKKCAGCHGTQGEGKPALKAPSLKGTTMDVSQLVQHITKGEATSKTPHNKGISGVSEEQAKAIAEYVGTLK